MSTLAQAMQSNGVTHIDLLKVDIEGSEYALFEAITEEVLSKIDAVVMEIHPVQGKRTSDITKKLERAGFVVRYRRTLTSIFGKVYISAYKEKSRTVAAPFRQVSKRSTG